MNRGDGQEVDSRIDDGLQLVELLGRQRLGRVDTAAVRKKTIYRTEYSTRVGVRAGVYHPSGEVGELKEEGCLHFFTYLFFNFLTQNLHSSLFPLFPVFLSKTTRKTRKNATILLIPGTRYRYRY